MEASVEAFAEVSAEVVSVIAFMEESVKVAFVEASVEAFMEASIGSKKAFLEAMEAPVEVVEASTKNPDIAGVPPY